MGLETRVHLSRWAVLECLGRKCGGFASLNICLPSLPGHVMPVTVYPHLVAWTRIDQAPPRTMGIDILFIPQFQRAAPHFKSCQTYLLRNKRRRLAGCCSSLTSTIVSAGADGSCRCTH